MIARNTISRCPVGVPAAIMPKAMMKLKSPIPPIKSAGGSLFPQPTPGTIFDLEAISLMTMFVIRHPPGQLYPAGDAWQKSGFVMVRHHIIVARINSVLTKCRTSPEGLGEKLAATRGAIIIGSIEMRKWLMMTMAARIVRISGAKKSPSDAGTKEGSLYPKI